MILFSLSNHEVSDGVSAKMSTQYLKGNMVAPYTNLELLLADNVLLWPVGVILPEGESHKQAYETQADL